MFIKLKRKCHSTPQKGELHGLWISNIGNKLANTHVFLISPINTPPSCSLLQLRLQRWSYVMRSGSPCVLFSPGLGAGGQPILPWQYISWVALLWNFVKSIYYDALCRFGRAKGCGVHQLHWIALLWALSYQQWSQTRPFGCVCVLWWRLCKWTASSKILELDWPHDSYLPCFAGKLRWNQFVSACLSSFEVMWPRTSCKS